MKYPNKFEIIRMKDGNWNAIVTDRFSHKEGAWGTGTSPEKALKILFKGLRGKMNNPNRKVGMKNSRR